MRTGLSRSVICPDVFIGQFSGRKSRYKMLASTHGPHVPATRERIPSSRAFEDLLRQAPADYFTLGWLLSTLHQRSFGVIILFLGFLTPVPLSNVVPSILVVLISLAYIQKDGLLLCVSFLAALILIGVGSAAVWGTIFSASLISSIW
jgi:hypothetical protein